MRKTRDYRQGVGTGSRLYSGENYEPYSHMHMANEIHVIYGNITTGAELDETAYDGFLKWVWSELYEEKRKQQQPLFRHQVILLTGMQDVDADITYRSTEIVIDADAPPYITKDFDIGEHVRVIVIGIYTAIRGRNPEFTRESFTAGEDMWDEMADML